MSERRRVLLLILIMATVALMVCGISIALLYQTAFKEAENRLVATAQSQARLLEAIARFDAVQSQDYSGGSEEATLSQMRDAHDHYAGFGETGEFTLAQREGDHMVFLLNHRHHDRELPKPVLFDSDLAEPMRRSLSGKSGTVVGLDYRGEVVLAAYEPVAELDWGIVAKIDLTEIRAPFVKAGTIANFSGLLIVIIGAILFLRATDPLLRQLRESEQRWRSLTESSADHIMLLDLDYTIRFINHTVPDLTVEQVIGRSNLDFVPPDQHSLATDCFERVIQSGQPDRYEIQYITAEEEVQYFDVRVAPVVDEDENVIKFIISSNNVTDRRQAEEALIRAHAELEQRIEERTADLVIANRQLLQEVAERKQVEGERTQYADRLQTLSRRLVAIQEEERGNIARELHDEIGQNLTGLRFTLNVDPDLLPDPVLDRLGKAQKLVETLIEQIRDMSLNLRPAMLDDLGLLSALVWHFNRFTEQTGVHVSFKHSKVAGRFPQDLETAIYRVVQEGLTNVARHAGVNEVVVRLWAHEDALHVQVQDEGRGFDPRARLVHTAGLIGMRERATLLGGTLEIDSEPGEGTHLVGTFPLGRPVRAEESEG